MNARLETTTPDPRRLSATQPLGEIAVQLPGATALFRRLKLDFCCGGHVSLADAAHGKGLDPQVIIEELGRLQRPTSVAAMEDPAALIDHLLSRYHEVHRQQFPELIRMARRVEAVHRGSPDVPSGLADLLDGMEAELTAHMVKEETVLFPALKAARMPFVLQPIAMMRAEHIDHGVHLEQLMSLTHGATPPAGACNTWRALYAGIAQLNEDLINHIHLENNVLFSQFDRHVASHQR